MLDAALAAAWQLPHGCKGGNCGLCKARLVKGEVSYPFGRPLGLSDAEVESGHILLCQAQPRSDLDLEFYEVRAARAHGASRLPCRIERATLAAPDVLILQLRLPPAVEFHFHAGQYVDILMPEIGRRSFSLASSPHDARLLELHVRKVPGGKLAAWLFGDGADAAVDAASLRGTLVTIEGPLGAFHYREPDPPPVSLLLVGGGTGIAPLLSILRHLIREGVERDGAPISLYWGVRSTRDLYAERDILELASRAPHMRYVPVLSEPDAAWAGRTGLVHAAVLQDWADVGGCDIYAAGPPAMIEAVHRDFPQHGARVDHLYGDSFHYAADAPPARQRSSAATNS